MYVSVKPGEEIIDSTNFQHFVKPKSTFGEFSVSGHVERDYSANPVGSLIGSRTFPDAMMLDEQEIRQRCEEKARKQEQLSDFIIAINKGGYKFLRQQYPWIHTNYCWCYAFIHACILVLLRTGQKIPRLTPESVAAPIKNYRNVGGWGSQCIPTVVNQGIASEEFWPMGRIDPKYYAPSRDDAMKYRMTEVYDLDVGEKGWWQKLSLLSHGLSVPSGYNWMGHEMNSVDVVIDSRGALAVRDLDSYAVDGVPNFRVLDSRHGRSDDQCCPRVMTAT